MEAYNDFFLLSFDSLSRVKTKHDEAFISF